MGIVRDLYMARKIGAGTKLPAPTVASLVKRLMLASIIGGTGEKKTVSGNAPLTLKLALEHDIKSLTQYGLCTQASTPSQADPVPIKCNNGTLKWDSVNQRVYADGTPEVLTVKPGVHFTLSSGDFESGSINESGEEIEDANSVRTKGFITVDPGTDYIVVLLTNNNTNFVLPVAEYSSEEVFIKRDTPAGARGRLITTGNDTGKIRIIVNSTEGSFFPSQITSVSLDTTLSSYNPAGKNLYSHQNSIFGYYLSSSGVPTIGPRACYSCKIPVEPAKPYTLSGISGETGSNNKRACFYKSNDTFISAQATSAQGKHVPYTLTFTPPANTAYCRLSLNTPDADVMLEEGSSKTTFEPYRDADWQTASVVDLLSVGDYKDEHEIISGVVKRKVGTYVLDGSETFGSSSAYGTALYINAFATRIGADRSVSPLCTHFVGGEASGQQPEGTVFFNASGHCYFRVTDSASDFKAFLKGQYDAGTPVILVFALATGSQTTESVAAQPLSTIQGGNIIDVIAEVSPIALSVTYFADGTVNNRQALRILLGDSYSNQGTTDDVSDKEALDIILGGNK